MFKIVSKLLMHNALSFEAGSIKLVKRAVVIDYLKAMYNHQLQLDKRGLSNLLYYSMKDSGYMWFKSMTEDFQIGKDVVLTKWGPDLTTLAGWGRTEVQDIDRKKGRMICRLFDSVMGKAYGPTAGQCVDHIFRGYLTGAVEYTFGKKVEGIESKCVAKGDDYCEFIVKETSQWDLNDPKVKAQLEIKDMPYPPKLEFLDEE